MSAALLPVPVCGTVIHACKAEGDTVMVAPSSVCDALGLASNKQIERLKRAPWASWALMATRSAGGTQMAFVIPLRALPMWLATIQTSRVAPAARPILERFQCEAADVFARHFLGEPAAPWEPPVVWADDTPEQIRELRSAYVALVKRLDGVESRVAEGERERVEIRRAIVAPAVQLALPHVETTDAARHAQLVEAFDRLARGAEVDGLLAREVVEYARAGVADAVKVLRLAGIEHTDERTAHRLGLVLRAAHGKDAGGKALAGRSAHGNRVRWYVESAVEQ
jgi:hypothetical protein